ncbi:MAG TPA: acetate uptake transporter, partial [Bryobacteraceae bacterium]|nr:acetate uptake transporter [Bryobacteraceae bacterium]
MRAELYSIELYARPRETPEDHLRIEHWTISQETTKSDCFGSLKQLRRRKPMSNEVQRPANPAPLGLAGFGLTTVVLSAINAGLLTGDGPTLTAVVVPLAFAFGGVAQIIAGLLEFKNNNTFGTVAFTSYGLFWWWYALMLWTVGAGWIKAPAESAVGLALGMWGVFTLYMWIPTFRLNLTLWSVFLFLWITFFLLA